MGVVATVRKAYREWRDEIFTTGREGILRGLSALVSIITARLLLPEGKGQLTTVLLWPNLYKGIGNFGLDHAIVYYVGRRKRNVESVVGTTLAFAAVQGVAVGIVGYVSIPYILTQYEQGIVDLTQLLFLYVPFMYVAGYLSRILHGMGDFDAWNGITVAGKSAYALGVVVLWWTQIVSVRYVVYAYVLSNVVGLVLVSTYLSKTLGRPRLDTSLVGRMLWYGGRNFLTSLTGQANSQLDQALISAFLSPDQLGLYRIAVSASRSIQIASVGFKSVLLSKVSRAVGAASGDRQIMKSLKVSSGFLSLSALVLIGVLPFLIPFMYGVEFAGAVFAAQLLLVATAIHGVKQTLYNGVRGQGDPEIPFYAELVGTVVTGIGLYLLLRAMGIEGAAVASLLAYGTSFVVAFFIFTSGGGRDVWEDDKDPGSSHASGERDSDDVHPDETENK